jgi:hypothetical protein
MRTELSVLPMAPAAAAAAAPAGGDHTPTSEPMAAPEPSLPAAPKRAATGTKRPRRRSDAGDETASEG